MDPLVDVCKERLFTFHYVLGLSWRKLFVVEGNIGEWFSCCACTVEVGSLNTLRLELLKLVFQPLHKILVKQTIVLVRTFTLCMCHDVGLEVGL
jgi:hypothetical protein